MTEHLLHLRMNKLPVLFLSLILSSCATAPEPYRVEIFNTEVGRVGLKCTYNNIIPNFFDHEYCSTNIQASQPVAVKTCKDWGYKDAAVKPLLMNNRTASDVAGQIFVVYQCIK